jgi:hypothetical protein
MDPTNAMRWDGGPGHYEVWYLTLTDPQTGIGVWIRWTMLAPVAGGAQPTCALWFCAMDPADPAANVGRKAELPISALRASSDPFRLELGDAELSDRGAAGSLGDARWELRWAPGPRGVSHVHPLLERLHVAKTLLCLPHPDLRVSGTISWGGRELVLDGVHAGQAHLWGSKHAARWAWAHAGDLRDGDGAPRPGDWLDGVSVVVPRLGRDGPPATPVVGSIGGEPFACTAPLAVARADSTFTLTNWTFDVRDGARRIQGEVVAQREDLVGVTYQDPDGELARCYNAEVATMRLRVLHKQRGAGRPAWALHQVLEAPGTAHFEYAQRAAVPGQRVLID